MEFRTINDNQSDFLPLLLLGDEQEDMIARYLNRGTLWALYDRDLRAGSQRRGYGRAMVEHVVRQYRGRGRRLLVGTGDSPLTVPFYEACGFRECGRVKDFFLDNYDHPIFEAGRQLVDMVYFSLPL